MGLLLGGEWWIRSSGMGDWFFFHGATQGAANGLQGSTMSPGNDDGIVVGANAGD